MGLIYMAVNTVNNKIYIGQTRLLLSQRKAQHIHKALKGNTKTRFYAALRKYGKDVFDWIELENVPLVELNDAERFWIQYYKSIGAVLYNLTNGGDSKIIVSPETCMKISQANKGNTYSRGYQNALGHKHTEEWKETNASRMKGNSYSKGAVRSDSHRDSVSRTHQKEYPALLSPWDEVVVIENMETYCKGTIYHPTHMRSVAYGKRKSHKGWTKA